MASTPLETEASQHVRLGEKDLSRAAGELHLFGVLLGAHIGKVGFVPAADVAMLPRKVSEAAEELVDEGLWRTVAGGFAIDSVHAARTMRLALDRLNDPDLCAATGGAHVRNGGRCGWCGAELPSAFA